MSDFSKRPKEVLPRKTAAKGFGETTTCARRPCQCLYISPEIGQLNLIIRRICKCASNLPDSLRVC